MSRSERSAADDLGLTQESRDEYKRRLSHMFAEGCAIFGASAAGKLFRDQAKAAPKPARGKRPPALPPRKRKGGHDPQGDRLLLLLWKTARNGMSKQAFAEMALKNHAVKTGKKVQQQTIAVRSMVRRLNRILKREAEMRQLGAMRSST
jgi:hypothetical protein